MDNIRRARAGDASRIAEIEIFNYRLNFYPLFRDDGFYFGSLQVFSRVEEYRRDPSRLAGTFVYDDGAVKGFLRLEGKQIKKLFVEPVLQGQGIGSRLLEYSVFREGGRWLWVLERNDRAIAFYRKNGFFLTDETIPEEGTDAFLVRMEWAPSGGAEK